MSVIADTIATARTALTEELDRVRSEIVVLDEQLAEQRGHEAELARVLEQLDTLTAPGPATAAAPARRQPQKRRAAAPSSRRRAPARAATGERVTRDQVLGVMRSLGRATTTSEIATQLDTDDKKSIENRITWLVKSCQIIRISPGLYGLPTDASTPQPAAEGTTKPPPAPRPTGEATLGGVPLGGPIGHTPPFDPDRARARAGGAEV